ncbi:MAG: hypothetical protein LBJ92_04875 [Holosporales bacterium]|jgi:hypothetical protein|nr:hypothetical protein [Holosporales bacterium]
MNKAIQLAFLCVLGVNIGIGMEESETSGLQTATLTRRGVYTAAVVAGGLVGAGIDWIISPKEDMDGSKPHDTSTNLYLRDAIGMALGAASAAGLCALGAAPNLILSERLIKYDYTTSPRVIAGAAIGVCGLLGAMLTPYRDSRSIQQPDISRRILLGALGCYAGSTFSVFYTHRMER